MIHRSFLRPWRACWLAFVMLLIQPSAWASYDVRDATGQVVHFDAPPRRVVSLLPSLTETVCALQACDRLVGVDRYSNWPATLRELPRVGGGIDPNVEAIVALKPDVVLTSTSSRAAVRLRALGLKVVALEPKTRADANRVIRQLAHLLQVQGADALLRSIDDGVAAAARSLPASARGQRVYFEVAPAPYAAGPGSFIGELLTALGLRNIIGPKLGPFPKINPELVVRAAPDVIMTSHHGGASAAELARRPGWAHLQALRSGRVCIFNADETDLLVRPGPRMAEAAQTMANCVQRVSTTTGK